MADRQITGRGVASFALAGTLAGVAAVLLFVWVHELLISDIWFYITPMVVAGAVCGLCVALSFATVCARPSLRAWTSYNLTYVGLLALLGVASMLAFQPVTTVQALIDSPFGLENAEQLMGRAMPLTVGYTVVASLAVTRLFGRRWWHLAPVLVTMAVVMVIFGLNISILGLVETSGTAIDALVMTFGLIVITVFVYAAVVAVFGRRLFRTPDTQAFSDSSNNHLAPKL